MAPRAINLKSTEVPWLSIYHFRIRKTYFHHQSRTSAGKKEDLLCIFFNIFSVTVCNVFVYEWIKTYNNNTGNCQKHFFTTGFKGLPSIPVMFTGSLQGRIDLQGVPCKPYREFPVSLTGFGFAVQWRVPTHTH